MLAVVATLTESLISRACFTASTYPFVAASCAPVGSLTFTTLALLASIVPVPFGLSEISPFESVLDISFPLIVILSAVKLPPVIAPVAVTVDKSEKEVTVVPSAAAVFPKVMLELSSCEFESEPILTAPFETEKSFELNEAIPLFDVVASSPLTVAVPLEYDTSIPSPAATITTPLLVAEDSSAAIVTVVPVAEVSIPSPPLNVNVSPIVAAAEPESEFRVISFADTAPLDTVKFADAKDAKPFALVVASDTAIVTVSLATVALTVPLPVNDRVSLTKLIESEDEEEEEKVDEGPSKRE